MEASWGGTGIESSPERLLQGGEGTGLVVLAIDSWFEEDQHVDVALVAIKEETEGGRRKLST
jgi:hypothetical protein